MVEARFDPASLPDVLTELAVSDEPRQRAVTLQVVQRLDGGIVRCVATSPVATLAPGMTILSAGRESATPVSREAFDRVVQLLAVPSLKPGTLVPTGIKVIDLMCPLVAGGTVAIAGEWKAGTAVILEELVRRLSGGTDRVSIFAFVRRRRWATFIADQARGDEIVIMESALLQYSIFVTLRRGVSAEVILAFLGSVADILRPSAPRLVYLAAPDPDVAYRAITARRGGAACVEAILPQYQPGDAGEFFRARGLHGFDGLLAYWREHNAVCERAVDALSFDTLVVDPRHGDWPWRRATIARFLGLTPAPEPTPPPAELARWVGRYRGEWKGEARECAVSVEDGRLVIDGLFWPRSGLLWMRDNVFDAEAWPFEVVCESAAREGRVGSLSVRGASDSV